MIDCCANCGREFKDAGLEVFCEACRVNPLVCRQNEPDDWTAEEHEGIDELTERALAGDIDALRKIPASVRRNFRDD